jgi:tRNA (cmo5U34)-methyltransferase
MLYRMTNDWTWARYEKLAPIYDRRIRSVLPGYDLMLSSLAAYMSATIAATARVLVVGAGTGNELLLLAQVESGWTLIGVEPCLAMTQVARSKIASSRVCNTTLVHASIFDIEGEDFDACSISLVMQLFDKPRKELLLRHVYRLLPAGAPLFLFDTCNLESEQQFNLDLRAMARHNSRNGLSEREAFDNAATLAKQFHLMTPQMTRNLLSDAGFENVQQIFQSFVTYGWICYRDKNADRDCASC